MKKRKVDAERNTTEECAGLSLRQCLSQRLRKLRKGRSLQLKAVAVDIGVSVAAVNAWELGHRFPSVENLAKLASFYDVEPHEFLQAQ